jgi:hypothetical protein
MQPVCNSQEIPHGFRVKGFTYFPEKLFFTGSFLTVKTAVFLYQRANWDRESKNFGKFFFRPDAINWQSQRHCYTILKFLADQGYIRILSRLNGIVEGVLSKRLSGPNKGCLPFWNQFLVESVGSETTLIHSRISATLTRHAGLTVESIRRFFDKHYRGINQKFLDSYKATKPCFSPCFSRQMPSETVPNRKPVSQSNDPESLPSSQEFRVPDFKPSCAPVPRPVYQGSGQKAPPILKELELYENLDIKVDGQPQKRLTYRIPKSVVQLLRSHYRSLALNFNLTNQEISFCISLAYSALFRDLKTKDLRHIFEQSIATFWVNTRKNRSIQTQSCIWNRCYAYLIENTSDWLWNEFKAKARSRFIEVKQPNQRLNSGIQQVQIADDGGERNPQQKAYEDFLRSRYPAALNGMEMIPFALATRYWNEFQRAQR